MSSLVPDAESKLLCTTMPMIHVLCNSAMTWRARLNDSKVCLEFQIDGLVMVGRRVQYMMDYTTHAHDPSLEEVQAEARVSVTTVSTSPMAEVLGYSADCT